MSSPLPVEHSINQVKSNYQKIIYIDCPNYTHSSNGIKCIYALAQQLENRGIDIKLIPRNIRGFLNTLPTKYKLFTVLPDWGMQAPGILICTESVPPNTIIEARKKQDSFQLIIITHDE